MRNGSSTPRRYGRRHHQQFQFHENAEENNAENLLVIQDKALANKYTENWHADATHSDPYAGRTEGYSQTHRGVRRGLRRLDASQVFRRAGCKAAVNISARNLVRYNPDEAVQAGRSRAGS